MADNNQNNKVQNVINSIPFENIIGGPLVACVGAQRDASFAAYNFMREVTMNETGENGDAEPVMVSFSFVKGGKKLRLNVPLLTIVPLPFIQIDYVDLAFTADVTDVKVENGVAHLDAKYSTDNDEEQNTKKQDETSESARSIQSLMSLNIRAVTSDVPPGLAKIQQIFGEHMIFDEVLLPAEDESGEVVPEEETPGGVAPEEEIHEEAVSETIDENIKLRLQAMIDNAADIARFDLEGPACFVVEDVFSIAGRGTVATGKLFAGSIKIGDNISVFSPEKKQDSIITGIEVMRKMQDSIESGPATSAGLLLRNLEKSDVSRGDIITLHDSNVSLSKKMTATIRLLTKEEGGRHTPILPNYRPQFMFFNTMNITGQFSYPEGVDFIEPGATSEVTIELVAPYYLRENDGFVFLDGGRTVGVGIINRVIRE